MNVTIIVPSSVLTMATTHVAQEDTRPALACVAFNLKNEQAYAANGFTLAAVEIRVELSGADGEFPTVLVHRSVLAQAKKLHDKKHPIQVTCNDGQWTVRCSTKNGPVYLPFTPDDATYPDCEQIIPKRDETTRTMRFNAKFIKELATMAQAHGEETVEITFPESAHAAMSATANSTLRMVVMPMVMN